MQPEETELIPILILNCGVILLPASITSILIDSFPVDKNHFNLRL